MIVWDICEEPLNHALAYIPRRIEVITKASDDVTCMHESFQQAHSCEPRLVPHPAVVKCSSMFRSSIDYLREDLACCANEPSQMAIRCISMRDDVELQPLRRATAKVKRVEAERITYVGDRLAAVPFE